MIKEIGKDSNKPKENTYQITTLQGLREGTISSGRMQGNTTRLIDSAIQDLFNGAKIHVLDHWEHGTHREANKNLFRRILKRLASEHPSVMVVIDKNKLTIEIIEKED